MKHLNRFRIICLAAALLLFFCAVLPAAAESAPEEDAYARLVKCRDQIAALTDFRPEIVLVLGTGLGGFTESESLEIKAVVSCREIEGWPVSTAPGHEGRLIFAEYRGLRLAIQQGRVHYYEGYSMEDVILPLRVLHLLGADTVVLTNATGAINPEYRVGDFVCVEDQITSFVPSPLIGPNQDELGERFVGMVDAFDPQMRETVLKTGAEKNIPVHSGVYLQVTGPQYETPAEIRMYRALGADTVGMSSGVEVIAARHMGMRACLINCVSNMAAGMEEEGFSHSTVQESVNAVSQNFEALLLGLLDSLVK